jgi:hypothetical protein
MDLLETGTVGKPSKNCTRCVSHLGYGSSQHLCMKKVSVTSYADRGSKQWLTQTAMSKTPNMSQLWDGGWQTCLSFTWGVVVADTKHVSVSNICISGWQLLNGICVQLTIPTSYLTTVADWLAWLSMWLTPVQYKVKVADNKQVVDYLSI